MGPASPRENSVTTVLEAGVRSPEPTEEMSVVVQACNLFPRGWSGDRGTLGAMVSHPSVHGELHASERLFEEGQMGLVWCTPF